MQVFYSEMLEIVSWFICIHFIARFVGQFVQNWFAIGTRLAHDRFTIGTHRDAPRGASLLENRIVSF